jgi:hypothetical protein
VARDGAKLTESDLSARGVATRAASIDDAAALDHAFADVAAVINCAGPFLDTAAAVAEAALRAGIHYLDVTAEQASAQATFEEFGDDALAADLVVLPAMSFYGGLADLLATAAVGDWDFADQVEVAVALDSWRPTLGTRITGHRNTAQRLMVSEGRLQPVSQPPRVIAPCEMPRARPMRACRSRPGRARNHANAGAPLCFLRHAEHVSSARRAVQNPGHSAGEARSGTGRGWLEAVDD